MKKCPGLILKIILTAAPSYSFLAMVIKMAVTRHYTGEGGSSLRVYDTYGEYFMRTSDGISAICRHRVNTKRRVTRTDFRVKLDESTRTSSVVGVGDARSARHRVLAQVDLKNQILPVTNQNTKISPNLEFTYS